MINNEYYYNIINFKLEANLGYNIFRLGNGLLAISILT
jgi:hypothetical protein